MSDGPLKMSPSGSVIFGSISTPVLVLVCGALALGLWTVAKPRRNLPPGPTPEPIIGNVRQVPTSYSWLTYTSLAEKFGMFVAHRLALTHA